MGEVSFCVSYASGCGAAQSGEWFGGPPKGGTGRGRDCGPVAEGRTARTAQNISSLAAQGGGGGRGPNGEGSRSALSIGGARRRGARRLGADRRLGSPRCSTRALGWATGR